MDLQHYLGFTALTWPVKLSDQYTLPSSRMIPPGLPTPVAKLTTSELNVQAVEKELLVRALKECDGNRTAAAEELGISVKTLYNKMVANAPLEKSA